MIACCRVGIISPPAELFFGLDQLAFYRLVQLLSAADDRVMIQKVKGLFGSHGH
jgi:hypothetical protein